MTQSLHLERFILGEERWASFPENSFQMRYLYLKAERPSGKPPVIFIHGFMGYSFSWRFNMREFARERDVYAIDLLGMGYSDRPSRTMVSYCQESSASRVLNWIESLGLSQVDIVGTSHGGAVSMMMAAIDRQRNHLIRRLVLVAPANHYSKRGRKRLWFFNTAFGARMLRAFGGLRLIKDFGLDFMYGDRTKITQETRDGYFKMIQNPASFDYALGVIATWHADMKRILDMAERFDMPTLFVWGDRDRAVPAKTAAPIAAHFKNARIVLMKGSGHLPYEEAPTEFNRIVLDWLDRQEPAGSTVSA